VNEDSISTGSLESRMLVASKTQEKQRRRTRSQLHQYNTKKAKQRNREDNIFLKETHLWCESLNRRKNGRRSVISIVNELNDMHSTNISKQLVHRCVAGGSVNNLNSRAGKKSKLMQPVETTLTSSLLTFIQLANSKKKKISDRKKVIKKLKVCMQGSKYVHSRFDHLYDQLMMRISDKIFVSSSDFKVEHGTLEWTTYTNINI